MVNINYKRLIVSALFILTSILHFIQPFIYGINGTTVGYTLFGIIYLILGILMPNKEIWTLWISAIIPIIGISTSFVDYTVSDTKPTIYPFLVLIDLVIIGICLWELLSKKNKK